MRRLVVCMMAALALTACQDREPTGPNGFSPQFSHDGPLHQEPGFYFISPTPPGNEAVAGVFDATLSPLVEIYHVGPDTLVASLTAAVNGGHYLATWAPLQQLPRGLYRIDVRSAPTAAEDLFYGSVEIELVSSGGSGLQVGGNTLPIKFFIAEGAGCPPDFVCTFISRSTGGELVIERGGQNEELAGLIFQQDFCARLTESGECLENIIVKATRYRGPERCIPDPSLGAVFGATIQYEMCIRVTTFPAGIEFPEDLAPKVFAYLCLDPRATGDNWNPSRLDLSLQNVIRVMSVEEVDSTGGPGLTGIGQPVTDLTNSLETLPVGVPIPTDCDHDLVAAADGQPGRFAALAQRAFETAVRFLGPAPLHARRRANIPIVASPIGFSRFGLVLPVVAEFDRDNSTGLAGELLPANLQPRVRVFAADTAGNKIVAPKVMPVPFVKVRFTVQQGGGFVPNSPATVATGVTDSTGSVSAPWRLGTVNPQKLLAEVGALDSLPGAFSNFPNGEGTTSFWWTSRQFTATALVYDVHFLTPLGASGNGLTNVTTPSPTIQVCGPLQTADLANLAVCPLASPQPTAPKPKNSAWESSWNTGKNGTTGQRYRIEVRVGNFVDWFVVQRGGGGGSGALGSVTNPYVFQSGSTIPIKFMVVLQ